MQLSGVDCVFDGDGAIRVRRIKLDDRWLATDQGRQWHDDVGRHVLIMLDGQQVRELILPSQTLIWELHRLHGAGPTMV